MDLFFDGMAILAGAELITGMICLFLFNRTGGRKR